MLNNIQYLSQAGGLFAVFTFIHFFVDWIFQIHSEAMVKHNHPWIRAKHCFIYTIGFFPIMFWIGFTGIEFAIASLILFGSHFAEDTYLPIYLWAKWIRKPPEMQENPVIGFGEWVKTPLGKILMIVIDQIVHLTFLWPVVYLAMKHM